MDFTLSEEQKDFVEFVHDWVEREAPKSAALEWEKKEHEFPFELFDKMTAAGFHGIGIPEEYGGQGGDIVTQMLLARGLSRSLAGLTWVWGITSFAGSKSVGLYGTEQQKKEHLPKIAAGEEKWAIGFTEPGGGTDVLGAMRTRATKVEGGWRINGQKTWSSMSHVADYILLLARSEDYTEKRTQGLTLFILPTKSEGVTIREIPKLGMRSLGSCDVFLDDVFVPDENVLGEPGRAWYMLLPTLNNERVMLASFCVGILDGVLEDAVKYMNEREAFGGTAAPGALLRISIDDPDRAPAQQVRDDLGQRGARDPDPLRELQPGLHPVLSQRGENAFFMGAPDQRLHALDLRHAGHVTKVAFFRQHSGRKTVSAELGAAENPRIHSER